MISQNDLARMTDATHVRQFSPTEVRALLDEIQRLRSGLIVVRENLLDHNTTTEADLAFVRRETEYIALALGLKKQE